MPEFFPDAHEWEPSRKILHGNIPVICLRKLDCFISFDSCHARLFPADVVIDSNLGIAQGTKSSQDRRLAQSVMLAFQVAMPFGWPHTIHLNNQVASSAKKPAELFVTIPLYFCLSPSCLCCETSCKRTFHVFRTAPTVGLPVSLDDTANDGYLDEDVRLLEDLCG